MKTHLHRTLFIDYGSIHVPIGPMLKEVEIDATDILLANSLLQYHNLILVETEMTEALELVLAEQLEHVKRQRIEQNERHAAAQAKQKKVAESNAQKLKARKELEIQLSSRSIPQNIISKATTKELEKLLKAL